TSIVRGWLTEQSLRQFLDIVDQTAVERMWKYRRAFWEAVYDGGLISEAWVAFGPLGARLARRAYGPDASFARLETDGKQVEQGHAVLLLKVGRFYQRSAGVSLKAHSAGSCGSRALRGRNCRRG